MNLARSARYKHRMKVMGVVIAISLAFITAVLVSYFTCNKNTAGLNGAFSCVLLALLFLLGLGAILLTSVKCFVYPLMCRECVKATVVDFETVEFDYFEEEGKGRYKKYITVYEYCFNGKKYRVSANDYASCKPKKGQTKKIRISAKFPEKIYEKERHSGFVSVVLLLMSLAFGLTLMICSGKALFSQVF